MLDPEIPLCLQQQHHTHAAAGGLDQARRKVRPAEVGVGDDDLAPRSLDGIQYAVQYRDDGTLSRSRQ